MVDNDLNFQEKIKTAFSKVKEHIKELEIKIKLNNEQIDKQKQEIDKLRDRLNNIDLKNDYKGNLIESSSGNQGVPTNKQQTNNKQTPPPEPVFNPIMGIKKIEDLFKQLTTQEFLIFLTIYQLEEDKGKVTYSDISKHLKLSESHIRANVGSIIRKGLPLIKQKLDNFYVVLSINKDFRDLSLKQKLINVYYQLDQLRKR